MLGIYGVRWTKLQEAWKDVKTVNSQFTVPKGNMAE